MFFIMGINSARKQLNYNDTIICNHCGKYGRYEVFVTYMCFSLFFIPIIKWNKRYYVTSTCCHARYELNIDVGKRLQKGEALEIREQDLTLLEEGHSTFENNGKSYKRCGQCGYEAEENFHFCPKCGDPL